MTSNFLSLQDSNVRFFFLERNSRLATMSPYCINRNEVVQILQKLIACNYKWIKMANCCGIRRTNQFCAVRKTKTLWCSQLLWFASRRIVSPPHSYASCILERNQKSLCFSVTVEHSLLNPSTITSSESYSIPVSFIGYTFEVNIRGSF